MKYIKRYVITRLWQSCCIKVTVTRADMALIAAVITAEIHVGLSVFFRLDDFRFFRRFGSSA
jgi:hypothetical protein